MPTPSIQTLRADAQQVLNLDSISAVRSVVAATLANANAGTPLNPNLTTQQLWNEFYQIVTQPKSDIESIIANQLMKFLFAPPAPGGAGADKQVIFNDGGVLAGDPQFLWNKTTNLLTVTGAATITGALTAQGTQVKLSNQAAADCTVLIGPDTPSSTRSGRIGFITSSTEKNWFIANNWNVPGGFEITQSTAAGGSTMSSNPTFRINNNSDFLFLDGAGGTRMTLNSTGLGVGVAPSYKLDVRGSDNSVIAQFGGTNRQVRLSTSAISAVDNASFNFIHTSGSGRFTFQNNSGTQTMLTIDDNGNNILRMPVVPPTLGANLEGTFNLTSNTNLRISVRGSDGVTRVADITLA